MKETFNEYKSTLERVLMKYQYLYNGDIISSSKYSYSEIKKTNNTSPSLMINTIDDIYNKSILNMINKPNKVINIDISLINYFMAFDNLDVILYNTYGIEIPLYYFLSENFMSNNSLVNNLSLLSNDRSVFPIYFEYVKKRHINNQLHQYLFTPLIENERDDEYIIYATDASIQSLVYSIQNMTYDIEYKDNEWVHTINYDLYDCKYKVYKISIKDISKLRDDKINELLGEN